MEDEDPLARYLQDLGQSGSSGSTSGGGSPGTSPSISSMDEEAKKAALLSASMAAAQLALSMSGTKTGMDGKPLKWVSLPDGSRMQVADNPDYVPPKKTDAGSSGENTKPPSKFAENVMAGISLVGMLGFTKLANFIATNPYGAVAAAAIGGYMSFRSVRDMMRDGVTVQGVISATFGFALTFAGSLASMWLLFGWTNPWLALGIAAAVVVSAILSALFGRKDYDVSEAGKPLTTTPFVFQDDWPIVMMTAGLLNYGAAFGFYPDVPKFSKLQGYATLQYNLNSTGLQSEEGTIDPAKFNDKDYYRANRQRPVYIRQGGPSGPDYVMIVSQENTRQDRLTTYAIRSGFRFATSKPEGPVFIPLMVKAPNGKDYQLNPDAIAANRGSAALAKEAPTLGSRGSTALQQAGVLNKDGDILPDQ
jgi:hypothetical protein